MKPWLGALCALALVLMVTAPGFAQQAPGPHGTPGQGQQPPPPGGMQGGGMMMCPMMEMMGGGARSGGMMGGGMPTMGGQMDPKTVGRMLQMRGEMMKAIADVLIKHGKAMEAEAATK